MKREREGGESEREREGEGEGEGGGEGEREREREREGRGERETCEGDLRLCVTQTCSSEQEAGADQSTMEMEAPRRLLVQEHRAHPIKNSLSPGVS